MNANDFSIKSVLCDISEVNSTCEAVEGKWLEALLLRIRVPKPIIRNRTSNKMSNPQWREYLFENFGVHITKDLGNEKVSVFKYTKATDENVKIAEWYMPEVIRVRKDKKVHCKLKLRYWQLL